MNEAPNPQPEQQPSPKQNAPQPQQTTPKTEAETTLQAAMKAQKQNTPAATKNATPAASNQPAEKSNNKRLLYGCFIIFGFSLLIFAGALIAFIGIGGSGGDNPIFRLLGVSGPQVINMVILITHFIFGLLTFVAFMATMVGIFKFATTKKVEKENRKKSLIFTFVTFILLSFLIFVWIFAYIFLSSKQTPVQKELILTEPSVTLDLTAPISITFDASKIPISTRQFEILTYEWDFGDGEKRTGGVKQTHQYDNKGSNGRFDVVLTITARDKTTGDEISQDFTRIVSISNVEALAFIEADPERGEVPLTVTLDASKSKDPDGEIQSYDWDLDEDDVFEIEDEVRVTKSFEKEGSYIVKLRIIESDGSFTIGEKTITVLPPDDPVALFEIENTVDNKLFTGKSYLFTAAKSTSPKGNITKYLWDMGDGEEKETRTVTYSYDTPGTYEISLQVSDETGETAGITKRITVNDEGTAPKAIIKVIELGETSVLPYSLEFDASSSTDANNDIVEYKWDFDSDGNIDATNVKTEKTYNEAGTFTVTLTVIDSTGNQSIDTYEVEVKKPGIQATLKATPTSGEIPMTVQLDASASTYPENEIVAFEWRFGDNEEVTRVDVSQITHKYTTVGNFTARVRVIGADGEAAEAEARINIRPISLKACFATVPEEGTAPLEVIFDPKCSTGSAKNFNWDFGGLGKSFDRKPTFEFKRPGTYTIKLEITDNQNIVDTFQKDIMIIEK
jgi:PKD repeat protein/energy-converting hydrogenase Eha subunit E